MLNFSFSDIKFTRNSSGPGVVVAGEIHNQMGNNFSSVAFRLTIFLRNTVLANATVVINAFPARQSRTFEKTIDDINYVDGLEKALRCEIYPESAY